MDVSNTVDVSDVAAVTGEVLKILQRRYPGFDFAPVVQLTRDFSRLYAGDFPGFRACDIPYHDAQHVLDVTLAMARLLDGHDSFHAAEAGDHLGPEMAMAGIAAALFHDSGYIRRRRDSRNTSGAAYTRVHVSRSARFMDDYLPTVRLAHLAGVCTRIVHFTGYEIPPEEIEVHSDEERRLGALLGSADLMAQMADVNYLAKCRDHLYREFEIGGMAGEQAVNGANAKVFLSPAHLLESTPTFIRDAIEVRLNGHFDGVHHFAATHFGGRHLYLEAIRVNYSNLQAVLASYSPTEK
tara:strand:- start:212467 stop:213354 length:888 start_codon:yes stop_codon:yes gene_type:complete